MRLFEESKFESKPLKSVALINPKIDKKHYKETEEVTFVPMASVSEKINLIDLSQKRFFKEVQKGYTAFFAGDVLFAKVTPCMENGKVALVPKMGTNLGFGSTEFHVVRANEGLHPKYLFYFMVSDFFRNEAEHKMTGAVGLRRVPTTFLEDAEIPFPSLDIQKKIVDKIDFLFSEIDSGTQELQNAKQKLELYKQSVLNSAIQGKLVPQDPKDEPVSKLMERIRAEKEKLITEKKLKKEKPLPPIDPNEVPFELPKGWEWVRLGDICNKITDGFHNTPKKTENGVPYISAIHVKEDRIDWSTQDHVGSKDHDELFAKASPQKGEILIVNIGAGSGDAAIIDVDYPFSFKNVAILKFNQKLINNQYLINYLHSVKRRNYLEITNGGLQPFLSLKILKEMVLPLPPQNEQLRISQALEATIMKSRPFIKEAEDYLFKVSLLKQSVLKSAFEGKLI